MPAKFQPTYKPAFGTPIDVSVVWQDDKKKTHTAKAQDWVRNVRTGKPLSFFTTGQRIPEDLEAATKNRVAELILGGTGGQAMSAA